ncbi:hypothetical protein, partial [Caballeronia sp. ATUFL_F1_KS4A]|uniref:hypothetical protein n=1 Tax=Caballeronia sp. ATUFL_F1_KS4A TaxID=2921768 RepID=UPI002028282E
MGRSVPFAYILYREFKKQNNTEEMTYYSTILNNYATLLSNIWDVKNDIPLQVTSGGNSNSRCMALYAISLAIEV